MPDNGFASNRMKKIEAITKPFKLDAVIEALKDFGISHLTFTRSGELRKRKGILTYTEEPNTLLILSQK